MMTYVHQGFGHALGWLLFRLARTVLLLFGCAMMGLVMVEAWIPLAVLALVVSGAAWGLTVAARALCRKTQAF